MLGRSFDCLETTPPRRIHAEDLKATTPFETKPRPRRGFVFVRPAARTTPRIP